MYINLLNTLQATSGFQIRVDGCTGKLSFSKKGIRNETYLQLKSLATSKNGTVSNHKHLKRILNIYKA
jgi:hypothetical protein